MDHCLFHVGCGLRKGEERTYPYFSVGAGKLGLYPGGGVLPIVGYKERLRPEGLVIYKRVGKFTVLVCLTA